MIALTRPIPDSLASCELTHLERAPIDVARARAQHAAYEQVLAALGCEVVACRRRTSCPTRSSSKTPPSCSTSSPSSRGRAPPRGGRRPRRWRQRWVPSVNCSSSTSPPRLDGGDVLRLGRTLYVGVGSRTNAAGVQQLRDVVSSCGYEVRSVAVDGCLHLKSAITEVAPGIVVLNPAWIDSQVFADHEIIEVDPSEPAAANVLRIGDVTVCAAAYPRTNARLSAVATVRTVDVSELAKAEGALTCCSLIFNR